MKLEMTRNAKKVRRIARPPSSGGKSDATSERKNSSESRKLSADSGFYQAVFSFPTSSVTINTAGGPLAHQLQVTEFNGVITSTRSAFFTVNPQAMSRLERSCAST